MARQELKRQGEPELSENEMAPIGAIEAKYLFNKIVGEKVLSYPGWGILPFHKLYIPRITELTWEFSHPTASYANKIYVL